MKKELKMESILHLLQAFLPVEVNQRVQDEAEYELLNKKTNEPIGMYSLNIAGELSSFYIYEENESGDVLKNELVSIAEELIAVFHPDKMVEYPLSSNLELDNGYMFTYEKKEDKYGLFLHSEGFTVSIAKTGQVQQFFHAKEEYDIIYPEAIISEEEALEKYMNDLDFNLCIKKFDKEIFKNGDDKYHLAYNVNEQAFDIPANGGEPAVITESLELEPIFPQEQVMEDLYSLIGFTSKHKLLAVIQKGNEEVEIWSLHEASGSVNDDMEEVDPHLIKLCFDGESRQLLQLSSGEQHSTKGEAIGTEAARQKALNVMFKFFPDADKRFQIEELIEYGEEDDYVEDHFQEEGSFIVGDEETIEFEDNFTYYFHLMHNGIRVDDCVSVIGIGKYTAKVNHFQLNVMDEATYQQLNSTPTLSSHEAKEIYKNLLKMELLFVREYNEDQKAVYTLSYAPAFPETIGHTRAIDAITGKAMFVDVGDATFY